MATHRLSGFTKVVGWLERRSVGGMEMDIVPGEEGLGRLLEPFRIGPPAMTDEFTFEVAPQPLNEVELGRVGG